MEPAGLLARRTLSVNDAKGGGTRSANSKKVQRWTLPMLFAGAALGCGTNQIVTHHVDDPGVGGGSGSSTGSGPEAVCSGQCTPLGPAGWEGPTLLWMGKAGDAPECPPSAPVRGLPLFAELNAPTLCDLCECEAPSGTCALPTTLTAWASTCPTEGSTATQTSFNAPADWSGACTDASAIPAKQKCNAVDCVQALTIAPVALTEAPCAVTVVPVPAKVPPTWGMVAQSCHGLTTGSCTSPSEICAPAAPPGFSQCLVRDGDKECPDPYTVRHVFYDDLTDTRSCSPCACGAPLGSNCTTLVSIFKDGACSSSALVVSFPVDATDTACFDILPVGPALGSKLASAPVYAPGVCQASGGDPSGEAAPAEPATFCCLP